MKRLLLSNLLLLSSAFLPAHSTSLPVSPMRASSMRASILQTEIAPFIQAEDSNQQIQSVTDILVTTESELDEARFELSNFDSLLESTEEELVEAQSDIVSLQEELITTESELDTTRSLLSDTDSLLESTRDILSDTDSVLESTKEVLVETQSDIVSLQEELVTTESELDTTRIMLSDTDSILESTKDVLVEAQSDISSLQEELITTESELDTTRTLLSDTDSVLESTEDELSLCDSIVDQAEDLMFDPSIPYASEIDATIASLFSFTPYAGQNPTDPLVERINNGLIPYLQAALLKLGEISPIKQITTGNFHTVVLTTNGKVYATGNNDYGQLGIGDVPAEDPGYRTTLTAMIDPDTSVFTAIAAGAYHTVALKDSGALYATGWNSSGQLGIGVPGGTCTMLTAMTGPGSSDVTAIAAGAYHTVALKDSGALYATGNNDYGQLGIGTGGFETNTNELTAMVDTGTSGVTAIAAGAAHTVALKDSGALYATGLNNGQLGIGVTGGTRTMLIAMVDPGTSGVTAIAAGAYHTVALKDAGALYATGNNGYGQLGIGVRSLDPESPDYSRHTLTAMLDAGTSDVTAIAAGRNYTVALKDSSALYATGHNNYGQLGIGVRSLDPESPDYLRHTLTAMIDLGTSGVTAITAGSFHTVALKDSGALYATGWNTYGQLGIGEVPAEDPGYRTTLTAIAGEYHPTRTFTGFYSF